jgi:hypothetical protein
MLLVTRGYGHGASIATVAFRAYVSFIAITTTISPSSDAAVGGWTPTGAATLSGAINETIPIDTNYIQSSSGPSFDVCRVQFAPPPIIPPPMPVHLSYRVSQDNATQKLNLTTTLKQGINTIAFWSNDIGTAGFTTFTQTLTPAQYAAISDWTNLFLEFDANSPNADSLSLLLTSQLGANADTTHTVYTQPWVRVVAGGTWLVGDIIQLIVNGINNSSIVLTSTNVSAGYVDVQLNVLPAGTYSVQSCIVRSGNRSAVTPAVTFTIFPYAFDGMSNLYAAHGLQRLLTSYTGPIAQVIRGDNATLDLFPMIDGYIDQSRPQFWGDLISDGGVAPTMFLTKLYDQSGNGRDAVASTTTRRPRIHPLQVIRGFSPASWGWRAQLYFTATPEETTPQYQLTVSNMGGYAQAIGAISIASSLGQVFASSSPARSPFSVSVNGGTNARAYLFTSTDFPNFDFKAGGRRTDADTEADSASVGNAFDWTSHVARWSYSETPPKLFYANSLGNSTTLSPFQTAGITDNTTSDNVIIGGNAGSLSYGGALMGIGWFQRKLTDTETSGLHSSQLNYGNIPHRPLYRPGVTLGMEAFRQALIAKLFVGSPNNGALPIGGFDTTDSPGDPLSGIGLSPSNLLSFVHHTILVKNDVGTTVFTSDVGVWTPTVGTSVGKFIVYQAGYEGYPPTASFNDGLMIKNMVETGYTMCYFWGPFTAFGGGKPPITSTLTPLRFWLETGIRTINALQGSFAKPPMCQGFSGGCSISILLAAVDTRIAATVAFDYNVPVYAETDCKYERMLPGLQDLSTTQGCDWPDLWLLATTGGSVAQRTLMLAYTDSQAIAQASGVDFFTPTAAVCGLYSGVFGTHFDTFDTSHEWGTSTIALLKNVFGRY